MFTKIKKVLGFAVEDNQILLAELHQSASRYRVERAETFTLPSEAEFTKPDLWAADLQQFLRTHQFSAKEVVIGLPAKWLLVQANEIPTVPNDALAGVVQLMAEKEFSLEMNDLVLDYTADKNSAAHTRLLVMATLRRRMEQILTAVRDAGLKVLSVTSSSLALLPLSHSSSSAARYMVYLRSNYVEIVEQNGVGFRSVKHLSFTPPNERKADSAPLGLYQQLNNYFALTPHPSGSTDSDTLIVWNGAEPQALSLETLEQHLHRPFHIRNGFDVLDAKCWDWQNTPEAGKYVAPVSLATVGLQVEPVAVDFLHSKVTTQIKSSHKKPLLYAAAAVAVLFILSFSLAWSWHQDSRAIAEMTAQLEEHKAEIEVAEELAQKISTIKTWYAGRPKVLDCMLELTEAFPEQGTIWVSSLALREDMRGIITGKSQNEAAFLDVLDKMNKNTVFANPKMLYLRNTGRNSQDLAFAIDFLYTNGHLQPNKDINNNSDAQTQVTDNKTENLDGMVRK